MSTQMSHTNHDATSGINLPPEVSFRKERIAGQWVYSFRHEQLGELGRIVLQGTPNGLTQMNFDITGDLDDPMTKKRMAIFKPLAHELAEKFEEAVGGPVQNATIEPRVVPPSSMQQVTCEHVRCETCQADVAFLIFAEGNGTLGELEDYARMAFSKVKELNVPTWVIGEPVGSEPLPERPANILKIWPEREPVQRMRPDDFNPLLDELLNLHCAS